MRVAPRLAVLGLLVLVASAVCVRLGFWQLDRLAQRRGANAVRAAALALAVVELDQVGDTVSPWRRVRVSGGYDPEREIVLVNRSQDGRPGVLVVTPLRPVTGPAVLVERGWLPAPDGATVDLGPYREPGTVTVIGVVIPPASAPGTHSTAWPLRVTALAPVAVAPRFPYAIRPVVVRQLPDPSLPSLPRRLGAPDGGSGPHLSYAVQWFSFAAVFLVGFGALMWRERRGARER